MTPSTNPARDEACDHVWSPPVATGRYCMLCDEPMPLTALAKPSSPAGGDVAIKPLLWHEILTHGGEALSANFGEWNRRIYLRGAPRHGRDAWIATEKAKAQADFDEYIRSALSPAPESGVDAVAVKALGPIPQFDSFAINPVGEGDICVEGSSRFAHERDVAKLFEWARAAQALLTSLSPAATSGSEAGGDDWTERKAARENREVEIMQEYRWGNLTPLGVANHLRRAGFNIDYAVKVSNALAKPSSPAGGDAEGWRPMSEAPKLPSQWGHGPRLLLTDGQLVSFGYWEHGGCWYDSGWLCEAIVRPTDGPGACHGYWEKEPVGWAPESAIAAALAALAAERERCARIAEAHDKLPCRSLLDGQRSEDYDCGQIDAATSIAAAIRAQGE